MLSLSSELIQILEGGGTLVVPTRQRAYAARLAYNAGQLERGLRVWPSPDVVALDAWLAREIELAATPQIDAGAALNRSSVALPRLLSPAEDWLLWRLSAAAATDDLDLVNRGALAESLRRASALAAEYAVDVSRFQDSPGTEPALLRDVQRAVRERAQALGASDAASILDRLESLGGAENVHFTGFLKLTPRLKRIMAGRRARGLDALPAHAATVSSAVPRAVVAADESDELERIALWCKALLDAQPSARILVMLPTSPGARERLATLIRQTVNPQAWVAEGCAATDSLVVIEGGSPLSRVPAIAHALMTLQWLSGQPTDFETVSEWLRAPYWSQPSSTLRARMDLWLRESGHMDFSLREMIRTLRGAPPAFCDAAQTMITQTHSAGVELGQGTTSPREWSERFREALSAFGWPGERTRSSADQQTVVRFHELLDEFGQLASAAQSLSRDQAIQCFGELAARTAFRPADDDAVVTISSVLADPIALYDGIWVAGLQADSFPQPVQPDPFLPLALQIEAGIPAASGTGRLFEAQAMVSAWRRSAHELVLSAPERSEDLELLPSPLLVEWLAAADSKPDSLWLPRCMRREGMLESLIDPVGLPWPADRPLPSGTRSLELQNLCPFRAYAELRLDSRELGVPEPGIAPEERGELLHAALHRMWKHLGTSRALLDLADRDLGALIGRCVAEAADALGHPPGVHAGTPQGQTGDLFSSPPRSPALMRECRRAERLIRVLCDVEKERGPFRVENTEFDSTLIVMGARLRVRIDRIDALESGGRAILDYKSGRRAVADWYGERPSHPQLLAYLLAMGDDIVAMATVNVTAREVRFDGIAHAANVLPKVKGVIGPEGSDPAAAWSLRRAQWRACIEQLAVDFLAGRAEVHPKQGACDYCHVASLCRIADRLGGGDEEDSAAETADE